MQEYFWPTEGLPPTLSIALNFINQIGGARLGGATKELPANLDTQKETPKSQISIWIELFWNAFLGCKC